MPLRIFGIFLRGLSESEILHRKIRRVPQQPKIRRGMRPDPSYTLAAHPAQLRSTIVPYISNCFFTRAKASMANSKSSRLSAADTCVRIRALPFGTTGKENATT